MWLLEIGQWILVVIRDCFLVFNWNYTEQKAITIIFLPSHMLYFYYFFFCNFFGFWCFPLFHSLSTIPLIYRFARILVDLLFSTLFTALCNSCYSQCAYCNIIHSILTYREIIPFNFLFSYEHWKLYAICWDIKCLQIYHGNNFPWNSHHVKILSHIYIEQIQMVGMYFDDRVSYFRCENANIQVCSLRIITLVLWIIAIHYTNLWFSIIWKIISSRKYVNRKRFI